MHSTDVIHDIKAHQFLPMDCNNIRRVAVVSQKVLPMFRDVNVHGAEIQIIAGGQAVFGTQIVPYKLWSKSLHPFDQPIDISPH